MSFFDDANIAGERDRASDKHGLTIADPERSTLLQPVIELQVQFIESDFGVILHRGNEHLSHEDAFTVVLHAPA